MVEIDEQRTLLDLDNTIQRLDARGFGQGDASVFAMAAHYNNSGGVGRPSKVGRAAVGQAPSNRRAARAG